MTPEEIQKSLQDKIDAFKSTLNDFATKIDIEQKFSALETEVKNSTNGKEMSEKMAELETAIKAQGKLLKEMSEQVPAQTKSLEEVLHSKKEQLDMLAKTDGAFGKVTIDFKTDAVSQTGFAPPAGVTTPSMYLPGIGQIPTRTPRLRQLFQETALAADNRQTVRYMEQISITDGTDAFNRGDLLSLGTSVEWGERSIDTKAIGALLPISEFAINNFSFVAQEVNNVLRKFFDLKVERQLWEGTGLTKYLKGIKTYATEFTITNTPLANDDNKFTDPGIVELIMAIDQVVKNNSLGTVSDFNYGAWMPNTVVMNGFDVLNMKLRKNKDGDIVNLPYLSQDGTRVGSINIIESPLVAAGSLLVGDFNFAELFSGGMKLEIGYNSDDFGKIQKSIRIYEELAALVRNVNLNAFVKVSSIPTALSAITKPVA